MKMALSEMIYFSSIPVKVTINEYLEIAKEFSTPKSNSFINGILDKIFEELTANNKIRKYGRGLN
jgi:N utilization substance protein B